MVAYVIAEADITDPERYEGYKKLTPGAIAAHGGRFVVRGGRTAVLEGDWRPKRIVVIEFPSFEQAQRFYDSPEYLAARRAREGAARLDLILVDGV
jgi:uncharacterized protein (DUF1330 family)